MPESNKLPSNSVVPPLESGYTDTSNQCIATKPIPVGNVLIGGNRLVMIAGPCAVESFDQIRAVAKLVRASGGTILRGGAFKPRTSPAAFQGIGIEAIKWLREAADHENLPMVTEVMDIAQVNELEPVVDMLQIGSRNMQNFSLLRRVGRSRKPVLLKRGMAATLTELLGAIEYITGEGNDQIVVCERGIRTFVDYSRSTFDLTIIPKLKQICSFPIIADPSHATGDRELVSPMARAAIAAGADGVMIEVHTNPDCALSDGDQSLYPTQLKSLSYDLSRIATAIDRAFPST